MSLLLLVRHGKASAGSGDYDRLSEVGFAQARLLGEHWATLGLTLDAAYVGPRRRQQETYDEVARVYRERGLAFPDPILRAGLDEHDAISLLFKLIPQLAATEPDIQAIADAMGRGEAPPLHAVLGMFKKVTRQWVRGEIEHAEVESWPAFRARVGAALDAITNVGRGKTVAAFTSAGAIAASVGHVLGISDEKVLDLSWSLYNASVSELAFSESGWGMRTFNGTAHLADPKLVTQV